MSSGRTLCIQDGQYCNGSVYLIVCVRERKVEEGMKMRIVCCKVFTFLSDQIQTSVRTLISSFAAALDFVCVFV